MAQLVTVSLVQPYKIRPEEEARINRGFGDQLPMSTDDWRRRVTEQFIVGAAIQKYGEQMARKDGRLFRGIKDALEDNSKEITLDGTQAEFLFDLFLSPEAESKVTCRPETAAWFFLWLEYLEELRSSLRAKP